MYVLRRGELVRRVRSWGLKLLERENNRKGTTTVDYVDRKKKRDRWLDESGIKRHATSSLSLITAHSARQFQLLLLLFSFCWLVLFLRFYDKVHHHTHLYRENLYIVSFFFFLLRIVYIIRIVHIIYLFLFYLPFFFFQLTTITLGRQTISLYSFLLSKPAMTNGSTADLP